MKNSKLLMLISLLVAIGLWMFVMGNVDPKISERVSDVKVEMQGTDVLEAKGLTATITKPKIVTVTIEGKRSQVKKVKDKGVTAYIDVSTCDYGKNETEIHAKLSDGANGVVIEEISSDTAIFVVK